MPSTSAINPVVAIVGATGAVGVELIRCLEERRFPLSELRLLASARSAGKTLNFRGQALTVRELTADSFRGVNLALFSAGASVWRIAESGQTEGVVRAYEWLGQRKLRRRIELWLLASDIR